MLIAVSGTHGSGKSTLVADLVAGRREYDALPDPFELIEESFDAPGIGMFLAQLRVSAERLLELSPAENAIAERCPLDFLAYVSALDELGRGAASDDVMERARALTARAMRRVDLLVLLPLTSADRIWIPDDEDLELRDAMNDALLDLSADLDLVGDRTRVVEITGDRTHRLALLDAALR